MDPSDVYRSSEGRTGIGQAVNFTCPPGEEEGIKKFLREKVRNIDIPTTGLVISHGGYCRYTRYKIVQHRYAGGGSGGCCGYVEILEIKDPPDGRWGIVIHEYSGRDGSVFTEWETVKDAQDAFLRADDSLPGFKRRVVCGALTPWFYAIGDELLIGDYTFPDGLQDDPVFRFGKKFVVFDSVFDSEGVQTIKTCMGTRFIEERRDDSVKVECYRLVYWNDGSVWDERSGRKIPRPVEEDEIWITEALWKFREMLVGKNTGFSINFSDGMKFVGKLVSPKGAGFSPEGDYLVNVLFKDGSRKEGWILDFEPTKENPNIVQYVIGVSEKKLKKTVARVDVKKIRTKRNGKKWAGVFFRSDPK